MGTHEGEGTWTGMQNIIILKIDFFKKETRLSKL